VQVAMLCQVTGTFWLIDLRGKVLVAL